MSHLSREIVVHIGTKVESKIPYETYKPTRGIGTKKHMIVSYNPLTTLAIQDLACAHFSSLYYF